MSEIVTTITLIFVFVMCALVVFLIWPLENILRRKEKKDTEKRRR